MAVVLIFFSSIKSNLNVNLQPIYHQFHHIDISNAWNYSKFAHNHTEPAIKLCFFILFHKLETKITGKNDDTPWILTSKYSIIRRKKK